MIHVTSVCVSLTALRGWFVSHSLARHEALPGEGGEPGHSQPQTVARWGVLARLKGSSNERALFS